MESHDDYHNSEFQVFVKHITGTSVYTFNINNKPTVLDLKRKIRNMTSIKRFNQKLWCDGVVRDTDLVEKYKDCTLNLFLPFLGGPEIVDDPYDLDTVRIVAYIGDVCERIEVQVKPYWNVGGRTGLINRALEVLDEKFSHNMTIEDVDLKYNGKVMNHFSRLCEFPDLTRGYIQFKTTRTGVPHTILGKTTTPPNARKFDDYEEKNNPYGYVSILPKKLKPNGNDFPNCNNLLVLERKDTENQNETLNLYETESKCVSCGTFDVCMSLGCSHWLCMKCGYEYTSNVCPECGKVFA